MARIRPHLKRAPITEALIDIHVRLPKGIGLEAIQDLTDQLEGYEHKGPLIEMQTMWTVTKEHGAREQSVSREVGARLHSTDQKYVLQVRTLGFTVSKMEPYNSWDALVGEARRLWAIYVQRLQPEAVVRVATRYINKLQLPLLPGEHFESFLTAPPKVPDELPQGLASFMQKITLVHERNGSSANVIQLLQEGPPPSDHVPIILDIDVFKRIDLPPLSGELWNLLADMRVFKNEIFYGYITERTAELLE